MNTIEKEANELVSELEQNNNVNNVWLSHTDCHYAEVCVEYNDRTLPIGFLQVVSNYGDLHIEGTVGNKTQLTVLL